MTFLNLTPSLPWRHFKTTNESAKSETLTPFCLPFPTGMWKDFHQNAQHWKQMCYRTWKYTVCRRVHTSFSPEILQAPAVKRLIKICPYNFRSHDAKLWCKQRKRPWREKTTTECRISTLNSSQRMWLEQRQNASAELGLSLYKWQTVLQF